MQQTEEDENKYFMTTFHETLNEKNLWETIENSNYNLQKQIKS